MYEPGSDGRGIESPYFAGSNIIHLHSSVNEMIVRPLQPSTNYNFRVRAQISDITYTDIRNITMRTAPPAPVILGSNLRKDGFNVTWYWPGPEIPSEDGQS